MDVDRRDFLKAAAVAPFVGQAVPAPLFPGFQTRRVPTSGATIHVVHGGSGPPLLLIHGYPQTHVEWHTIAGRLAERFTLSDRSPAVLRVPAGYVNGFMTLTEGAKAMFFSTSTLEESLGDDFRFPARYWDPWHVEER